jgi:hypothetical protein
MAFAGMLATVVAADAAFAVTLEQLRNDLKMRDLDKPKVRAGSLPGHPDKMLVPKSKSTDVRKPPPAPAVIINHLPSDYSDLKPRPGGHHYSAPVCHDGTCESE